MLDKESKIGDGRNPEQMLIEAAQRGNLRAKNYLESTMPQKNKGWTYGSVLQQKYPKNHKNTSEVEGIYLKSENMNLKFVSEFIRNS